MAASGRRTTRQFPSRGSGDVERVSRRPPLRWLSRMRDLRRATAHSLILAGRRYGSTARV